MSSLTTPIVLALSLALAQGLEPRITYVEGAVSLSADGVRTAGGRAELVLGDGTLVHLDGASAVHFDRGTLTLGHGRLLLRTANGAPSSLEVPYARLRLAPSGVYNVLADAAHGRLLVSVIAGRVELQGRYSQSTDIAPGQLVMMTSATSTPWATAFQPSSWDRFELWSDARLTQATGPLGSAVSEALAESGASLNTYPASPTCSSWMSVDNPCWLVPAYPPAWPGRQPHRTEPPGYAPDYRPNYTPNFNVPPPGSPAGGRGPAAGEPEGSGPAGHRVPPHSARPNRIEGTAPPAPRPAPLPPGPAPKSGPDPRGTGGGIRGVPERPSPQ